MHRDNKILSLCWGAHTSQCGHRNRDWPPTAAKYDVHQCVLWPVNFYCRRICEHGGFQRQYYARDNIFLVSPSGCAVTRDNWTWWKFHVLVMHRPDYHRLLKNSRKDDTVEISLVEINFYFYMSFKIQRSFLKGDHRLRFVEQLVFHYLYLSLRELKLFPL